ncbi:MAG: molecular chaperone DnaJ, partial [Spirochaetia bacterium]
NYRNFLKEQKNDFYYQSKLIFHDLLHNNPDEAMELYEQLCRIYALNIREYLEREDYMDCCFLLAEEYEKRGEFVKAYQHLKIIVLEEQLKAYFRHFIEEVVDRLRTITCFKMPSILPPRLILDYLNELINFDFSKKDNAFFYKKISEVYAELGDEETAVHFLQKGLSLDKNLAGVKKLKDKLGYTQAS